MKVEYKIEGRDLMYIEATIDVVRDHLVFMRDYVSDKGEVATAAGRAQLELEYIYELIKKIREGKK